MAKGTAKFIETAPWVMEQLISDFNISEVQAAAVLGNLGHESGGFNQMQEVSPLGGGQGGYGWAQWTGPRRRQFFAWCEENDLSVNSREGNYGFLKHELKGTESRAMIALRRKGSLRDAVIAFEMGFERAGVKHYDSRIKWAEIALDAYRKIHSPDPSSDETP